MKQTSILERRFIERIFSAARFNLERNRCLLPLLFVHTSSGHFGQVQLVETEIPAQRM